MYCNQCEQNPCDCQRALTVQVKQPLWLIQPCTSCRRAVIRVPVSQSLANPMCKWCEGQTPQLAVLDAAVREPAPRMTAVSELLKKMQLANS